MKRRLIMMIGLPRSGKSTWAFEMGKELGAPIVASDAMRLAVYGRRWWAQSEHLVWAHCKTMVIALFETGYDTVILDSTNTTENYRREWYQLCDEVEYVYVSTPVDECKRRALATDMPDLLPIIDKMFTQLDVPMKAKVVETKILRG